MPRVVLAIFFYICVSGCRVLGHPQIISLAPGMLEEELSTGMSLKKEGDFCV